MSAGSDYVATLPGAPFGDGKVMYRPMHDRLGPSVPSVRELLSPGHVPQDHPFFGDMWALFLSLIRARGV